MRLKFKQRFITYSLMAVWDVFTDNKRMALSAMQQNVGQRYYHKHCRVFEVLKPYLNLSSAEMMDDSSLRLL